LAISAGERVRVLVKVWPGGIEEVGGLEKVYKNPA
jgi:hypothetical protein